MHPVFKEAPRKGPKLGKRQRRAVIRVRHVVAAVKFIRWAHKTNRLPAPTLGDRPWRTSEWHQWHALGCP